MNWIRAKLAFLWAHRTKVIGILAAVSAAIENLCAQYGHEIPLQWRGILLGAAGMITFCIGVYNSFKDA